MQYRAQILKLKEELGLMPDVTRPDMQSLRDETKRVKNENVSDSLF